MQIIVQEGRASLSLIHPIVAHDDLLRSTRSKRSTKR